MSTAKKELNEYLFYEFGSDTGGQDHSAISEDSPFLLSDVGPDQGEWKAMAGVPVHPPRSGFLRDRQRLYDFLPAAGTEPSISRAGSHWIADEEPIDLDTICGTESDVPRVAERRARVNALARSAADGADVVVLKGLYLARRREYLVLAQPAGEERAHVIGDRITLRNIRWRRRPDASPSALAN